MLLKISHVTEFSYREPVRYALQRLRLTPRESALQTVIDWETVIEGGEKEVAYDDPFGNWIELVSVHARTARIKVTASGTVETRDLAGVSGANNSFMPLWLYMRETVLTKPGKAIRDLARSIEKAPALEQLHALKTALRKAMDYQPGTTAAQTSAEDALAAGKGVCQDHAQAFVAAARLLGHPARYVSGYLMMDGQVQQAASHAWAEAHIEGLGWVGFDAANDQSPDGRYVHIAYGLDYADAAPVSGIRHGAGEEEMSIAITVEQQ